MVRVANKDDLPSLIAVVNALQSDLNTDLTTDLTTGLTTWSESKLESELKNSNCLISEDQSAFVLYRTIPDGYEVLLLATHPDKQNRGVMQKILKVLLSLLKPNELIWLEVHEKNVPAQKLYEKIGFKVTGRRPRYYADGAAALNLEYRA